MVAKVELRQFRYFIAVAEELHFGRAAARLHIAQPGLSQQIKSLERALGVQLLIRDSRGVELTEPGRVFLDHVRQVIEVAGRAVASARLAEGGKTGLLRVGTPALGMPPVAERVVRAFGERFPEVEVEIHPDMHTHLIDQVSRHSLDVALVLSPYKAVDPPPRYLRLGSYEIVAVIPKGHRLAALDRLPRTELLTEPFLDWPRSVNPELIDHLHRALFGEVEHPRLVEVAELEEARRFEHVANGTGIAVTVLPGLVDHHRFPGVVLRHFEEPAPSIDYGIVWPGTQESSLLHAFLEVAEELADSAH
jgi:DNA-binding transcriptional LysR family regulator